MASQVQVYPFQFFFDWCQCPMDIFKQVKADPVLSPLLWAQNLFTVIELSKDEPYSDESVQRFVLQMKEQYKDQYVLITSTRPSPGFYSNDDLHVLNHMIHEKNEARSGLYKKVRLLELNTSTNVFFTLFKGRNANVPKSTLEVVKAVASDLYQIYSASRAPSSEYLDNVHDCYFAEDYEELVERFGKRDMFVVKYKGQVFGFLEFRVKQISFVADNRVNDYFDLYQRHGFDQALRSGEPLTACYEHYTCSFSRWTRLHQDALLRGIGKMLWDKFIDYLTSSFPFYNILVYGVALRSAIPFHK